MKLTWTYAQSEPIKLYTFLRQIGMARMQIKKAKFHGGEFFVNAESVHTNFVVHQGDVVDMVLAPDKVSDQVIPYSAPFDIVYEDRDYLVVNKPAGIASIPDVAKSPDTMANRVKAYLIDSQAESTAIHVVTRLDRDTSGLMLFAKHSLAHSLIDTLLHTDKMQKHYLALVSGAKAIPAHGWLVLRLGRTTDFYMHRGVVADGKVSVTEYEVLDQVPEAQLIRVRLHTGRTHQIRTHFSAIGHPLLGDDLYGGPAVPELDRQALHCAELDFWQPLTQQMIHLKAPLPKDMTTLAKRLQLKTANLS